jgi:large subunit ribosomal protein L31
MKAKIHPKYYDKAQVSCACGNVFTVGSTRSQITVEICYKCHPLFTGEERFVDTQGQVEKFMAKQDFAKKYLAKKKELSTKTQAKKTYQQKTLKDLLSSI